MVATADPLGAVWGCEQRGALVVVQERDDRFRGALD